jgi:hypothetical protein
MNAGESLTNAYPGTLIYKNAVKRGLIKDEWDYLQQLKFGCDIWDYTWINRRHLNISEIPNERFWGVIIRELRRYNTFLLNRFKVKNIRYKLPFGLLIKAEGFCPDCGGSVYVVSRRSLLGLKAWCRNCFQTVIFNLYELEEFKTHFVQLRAVLQKAKRLVISGTMKEAVSMLRYDYFGLDYDRIVGFVEVDDKKNHSPDFIYKPKLKKADLLDANPDTILIVDDYIQDAELIIRHLYLKKNLIPPSIVHLWPDSKRLNKRMFYSFSLVVQLMLFYFKAKRVFFYLLESTYNYVLKSKQSDWIRSTLVRWRKG